MTQFPTELVEGLREAGYAIELDGSGLWGCECVDLIDRAVSFVESALTVVGRPASGRAYIRFSCSHGRLFVEVTHLGPGTFDAVLREEAAVRALERLRAWAATSGRSLTVERGPRDQFRITVVLEPTPTPTPSLDPSSV